MPISKDQKAELLAKKRRFDARKQTDQYKIAHLENEIEVLQSRIELLERDIDTDRRNIRSLLNAVNHVTSSHRHGTKISIKSLDRLANAQVSYEQREDNRQG